LKRANQGKFPSRRPIPYNKLEDSWLKGLGFCVAKCTCCSVHPSTSSCTTCPLSRSLIHPCRVLCSLAAGGCFFLDRPSANALRVEQDNRLWPTFIAGKQRRFKGRQRVHAVVQRVHRNHHLSQRWILGLVSERASASPQRKHASSTERRLSCASSTAVFSSSRRPW
jgi:hypothetical protein